jgi:hypothetical protein
MGYLVLAMTTTIPVPMGWHRFEQEAMQQAAEATQERINHTAVALYGAGFNVTAVGVHIIAFVGTLPEKLIHVRSL